MAIADDPKPAVRYRYPGGATWLKECHSPAELESLMADKDGAICAELVTRAGDQIHLVTVAWSDLSTGYLWACECGKWSGSWLPSTEAAYALAEVAHPIGCPWLLLNHQ